MKCASNDSVGNSRRRLLSNSQMIDKYLPNLTHPDVKTLAERMRSAQVREIDEMTKKLGRA